mgnify:CR=1 FL=1
MNVNYLAHIFLSGNHPEIQLGNFFGDFVKGTQFHHFPKRVREGIVLHRKIDEYTDSHPVFRETVHLLKPDFGRYAGIMADMYYDHLLAVSFHRYSEVSLRCFAYNFYFHALLRYPMLPPRIKRFIFHFVSTNRLQQYATYRGLQTSLEIMRDRKSSAFQPELAIRVLDSNFNEMNQQFHRFFPDIVRYSAEELNKFS